MAGKYAFKKLETGEGEPVKDKWSDVADCLQYLCLFLGEGRRMIGLTAVQVSHAVKVASRRSLRRISA
jgi:type VI protein secretion system component VasF